MFLDVRRVKDQKEAKKVTALMDQIESQGFLDVLAFSFGKKSFLCCVLAINNIGRLN